MFWVELKTTNPLVPGQILPDSSCIMTWGLITPKFRLLCVPLTEAFNCMFGLLLSAVTPLIGICTGPAVVSVNVVESFAANTADAIPEIVAKFSVTLTGLAEKASRLH